MGGGGGGRKRLVGESFAAFPSMVMTPEVIRVRDKPDAERPLKGFTPGMWGQREVKITPGTQSCPLPQSALHLCPVALCRRFHSTDTPVAQGRRPSAQLQRG